MSVLEGLIARLHRVEKLRSEQLDAYEDLAEALARTKRLIKSLKEDIKKRKETK